MVVVDPMPNELAAGQFGRLARINGLYVEPLVKKNLRSEFGEDRASLLECLARSSGQPLLSYAQNHTMFPEHYSSTESVPSSFSAMQNFVRAKVHELYHGSIPMCVCPQCVQEDMDHWGFSWYRRDHQLWGAMHCSLHGCLLLRTAQPDAFMKPPHLWTQDEIRRPTTGSSTKTENRFLKRFLDISVGILNQVQKFDTFELNQTLIDIAHDSNLLFVHDGSQARGYLDGHAFDEAPREWLKLHFGLKVTGGTPVSMADLTPFLWTSEQVQRRHWMNYPLIMATLFDSADEAFAHCLKEVPSRRQLATASMSASIQV